MSDVFDSAPEPGRPEDFPDFDPGPARDPIPVQNDLVDLSDEEAAEVIRFLELAGAELTQPGCPTCGHVDNLNCANPYHAYLAQLKKEATG